MPKNSPLILILGEMIMDQPIMKELNPPAELQNLSGRELLAVFLDNERRNRYGLKKLDEKTIKNYYSSISKFLERYPEPREVTFEIAQTYQKYLEKELELSNATINQYLKVRLSSFFSWLKEQQIVWVNPFSITMRLVQTPLGLLYEEQVLPTLPEDGVKAKTIPSFRLVEALAVQPIIHLEFVPVENWRLKHEMMNARDHVSLMMGICLALRREDPTLARWSKLDLEQRFLKIEGRKKDHETQFIVPKPLYHCLKWWKELLEKKKLLQGDYILPDLIRPKKGITPDYNSDRWRYWIDNWVALKEWNKQKKREGKSQEIIDPKKLRGHEAIRKGWKSHKGLRLGKQKIVKYWMGQKSGDYLDDHYDDWEAFMKGEGKELFDPLYPEKFEGQWYIFH
ncbi:MAG: hypothetical protein GF308_02420 [Candidatus Heimdallarchaeota archaeon]|nr:hypothetical protein [Candidatus Heimdallarchaeota archaeon]